MLTLRHQVIMPLNNPQLENSYYKVVSVIESCKTKEQLEGAFRMVENFKELYGKVGYPKVLLYNLDRKLASSLIVLASIESVPLPTRLNNFVDNKKPLLLMHLDDEEVASQINKDLQECFIVSDKLESYEKNLNSKSVE